MAKKQNKCVKCHSKDVQIAALKRELLYLKLCHYGEFSYLNGTKESRDLCNEFDDKYK